MNPKILWLRNIGIQDVGAIVTAFPTVLGLNLEKNMRSKEQWLRELGIKDIGSFIAAAPAVLGLDLEKNLKPKVLKYFEEWGVSVEVIEHHPILVNLALSRINEISEWAKIAGINIKEIPTNRKVRILTNGKLHHAFHELRVFRDFILARVPDREMRLKILDQVVPELHKNDALFRIFPKRGVMSRVGREECASVIEKLISTSVHLH